MLSLALLLLQKAANTRTGLLLTSILGILSGLALTNRLTDGAALFVGVGIAIVCLAPSRRPLSVLLFSADTQNQAALALMNQIDELNADILVAHHPRQRGPSRERIVGHFRLRIRHRRQRRRAHPGDPGRRGFAPPART